jgi:hypothetical protein
MNNNVHCLHDQYESQHPGVYSHNMSLATFTTNQSCQDFLVSLNTAESIL